MIEVPLQGNCWVLVLMEGKNSSQHCSSTANESWQSTSTRSSFSVCKEFWSHTMTQNPRTSWAGCTLSQHRCNALVTIYLEPLTRMWSGSALLHGSGLTVRHFLYANHEQWRSVCQGLLPNNMNDESPSLNSPEECGSAGGATNLLHSLQWWNVFFLKRFYEDHLYSSRSS